MHLSFEKMFYVLATLLGVFSILIFAKAVLIPLTFAFLFSCILFPIVKKIESWGANEVVSAFFSIFGLLVIITLGIILFSNQIIHLSENFTNFKDKILDLFAEVTFFINNNIGFLPQLDKGILLVKIKSSLNESSGVLLRQTFSSTANIIFGLLTSFIFTFMILIYRKGLKKGLVCFYPKEHRDKALTMFKSVQQVGQQYFFGLMTIIVILGILNTIGLWIIGIDNPFLFGFLAAFLGLIPYAGTFLGSSIPVLYSLMSYDSIWMPISIAIFFWLIQLLESNYLTPRIVGGNLKINAITSILSILIGASIWGIAGMILFLPLVAMLKKICEEYIELKPLALLMGELNCKEDTPNKKYEGILLKIKDKIRTIYLLIKKG